MFTRTQTRSLKIGDLPLGGGAPVSVQTMANVDPHDAAALAAQVASCAERGADVVRLTVPDIEAARRSQGTYLDREGGRIRLSLDGFTWDQSRIQPFRKNQIVYSARQGAI